MARQMKDSGIEWIGEIPEGWVCCKQKHVIGLINGRAYKDDEFLPEAKYRVLRVGNLFTNSTWYYSDMELEADKYCENGDLIYAWSASYGPYIWDGEKIIYHYHIWKTVLANFIDKKYAYYYLLSLGDSISSESHGSAMQHITMERMNNSYIAYPDLSEQKRIAAFLDRQCAEIDAVIERTKATIEEYKKLKQAVITEAVTKGVRGARKMKDSGIGWIGEIPEEWSRIKTLYALSMPITDGPHETPELFDTGVPFVSAEAVSCGKGSIDFNHIRGFISEEYYQECCKKYIPQINDILMIKSGATTGRVSVVDTDIKFTIWSPLAVFRCNADIFDYRYLFFFLQSDGYQKQIENKWTFGTQQNIGMRTLEQLIVCYPPLDEQREIAVYLDEKCAALDTLIAKKTALLTELETYKKSLIYEYVSGKKEVV